MDDLWEPMLVAPPAAPSSHLTDGELFNSPTQALAKHLTDCAWCRHRLDAAHMTAESEDDESFELALRSHNWSDDFAQVSRETILPDQVRAAMTAPASVGDVEPGQLWRLTWRARHLLVAVIDVADWQVLSAPVTTDTDLADELTLVVKASQSPLAIDLAIWVRNRATVPLFVFDRPLGSLPPASSSSLSSQAALRDLAKAHLTGSAVPGDFPVGVPLTENDVDRLALHDGLQEQVDWFSAATAGLFGSDGVMVGAQHVPATGLGPARPLSSLIRDSGLTLTELAGRTGLEMPRLLDLARPGATARPEEVAAIEEVTGAVAAIRDEHQVKAVTALAEVSRPTWRAARERWARRHHASGTDFEDPAPLVTRLLYQPVAARNTHHTAEAENEQQRLQQQWRDRLAMILSE
jgi:hypothetical protein